MSVKCINENAAMAEAQRLYRLNELVARDIFGVCKEMAAEAAIFLLPALCITFCRFGSEI